MCNLCVPLPLPLHALTPTQASIEAENRRVPFWLEHLCPLCGVCLACAGAYAIASGAGSDIEPVTIIGVLDVCLGLLLLL